MFIRGVDIRGSNRPSYEKNVNIISDFYKAEYICTYQTKRQCPSLDLRLKNLFPFKSAISRQMGLIRHQILSPWSIFNPQTSKHSCPRFKKSLFHCHFWSWFAVSFILHVSGVVLRLFILVLNSCTSRHEWHSR